MRMRVCSGFAERVLPLGEVEYSERVLALWASAQNSSERAEEANGSLLKVLAKSIAILRLLKTGEQHRRMGVFGKSIGIMGEFSKLFRESRRGEWESSKVFTEEYCHSATSQNFQESSIGEWESSQVFGKSIGIGRVRKTGEQHRRMGVSGFGERVLPFCDFSWRAGEWESSERVLALWASSQNSSERAE